MSDAESVGFEPTGVLSPPVFKTGAIDHSANSPNLVRPVRIELTSNGLKVRCLTTRLRPQETQPLLLTRRKRLWALSFTERHFGSGESSNLGLPKRRSHNLLVPSQDFSLKYKFRHLTGLLLGSFFIARIIPKLQPSYSSPPFTSV